MIQDRNFISVQTKVVQVVCGLVLFAAACLALVGLMRGSYARAGIVLSLLIGLAAVLMLDERYWLLLPILSYSHLAIPGLPFTGAELGCLTVTATHAVRLVLRRDPPLVNAFRIVVVLPLLLWIAIVFMLNPVGLAILGSRVMGGRFYFDIAIGFSTLFSLASLRIGEKDAKILFFAILVSNLYWISEGVLFPRSDPDALVFSDTGLEQEVSARYALITCSVLFALLFAKWSMRDILVSPVRIAILSLLAVLTVYSGKRQAFGTIALVPFFRMILKGKEIVLTCAMGILAALVMAFAVAGDDVLFSLPLSAKRALAVVAPKYERETAGGIHDLFRREMRKQSYALISENPLFGRKGFAMDFENTRWLNFGGGYSGLYAGHAYAGNWHNMWLAYACDFGLPGLCLAIFFWLWLVRFIFKTNRTVITGVYLPACVLFCSYKLLELLVFSWVAGHASRSTYDTWIQYGLLLALANGYQSSLLQRAVATPIPDHSSDGVRPLIQTNFPASEGGA